MALEHVTNDGWKFWWVEVRIPEWTFRKSVFFFMSSKPTEFSTRNLPTHLLNIKLSFNAVIPKLCVAWKVKIFLSKLSKFSFSNCQKFRFQTVKNFVFKLSKFSFPNCQKFLFQTVKISFQTVKIFLFKLSKIYFSICQNFPFQTVKNFLFKTVKIFLFKLSKFSFPNCQNFLFQTVNILAQCVAAQKLWKTLDFNVKIAN